MTPEARLNLSLRLQELSSEQRAAFLQECLRQNDPAQMHLLSLLLLGWADSSPSGACEWVLSHLDGPARRHCLCDLFETWAARDAMALAKWCNDQMTNGRPEGSALSEVNIVGTLSQHDPVALAHFAEMECN